MKRLSALLGMALGIYMFVGAFVLTNTVHFSSAFIGVIGISIALWNLSELIAEQK
jgi:hypothetical protein